MGLFCLQTKINCSAAGWENLKLPFVRNVERFPIYLEDIEFVTSRQQRVAFFLKTELL